MSDISIFVTVVYWKLIVLNKEVSFKSVIKFDKILCRLIWMLIHYCYVTDFVLKSCLKCRYFCDRLSMIYFS